MNLSRDSRSILAVFSLIAFASCNSEPSVDSGTEKLQDNSPSLDQVAKLDGEVSFTLEDAEILNRENPDTFWIPSKERRENLVEGELVKLVFNLTDGNQTQGERMWVLVKSVGSSGYLGVLDNDPYSTDRIKAGSDIPFEPRHVIDIFDVKILESEDVNVGDD